LSWFIHAVVRLSSHNGQIYPTQSGRVSGDPNWPVYPVP